MRRAISVIPAHEMQTHVCAGRVRLEHDLRHRRRIVLKTVDDKAVLLDLPNAAHLRGGEGLLLEDGDVIAIEAVPEKLLEITAPDKAALIRIAWHLGNRHLPTQLEGETLRIREDHVLEEMVLGLGGKVAHIEAAFDPEGGAYAGVGGGHHHDDHDHAHGHDHSHSHKSHSHSHSHRHDDE